MQGGGYRGQSRHLFREVSFIPPFSFDVESPDAVSGGDLLARWTLPTSADSGFTVQTYVDRTQRSVPVTQRVTTYDIDLQHRQGMGSHTLIWGAGYRVVADQVDGSFQVALDPGGQVSHLFSAFVEDLWRPGSCAWFFTLGCKFEHNDFSGFEVQPTARLLRRLGERSTVWAAVSRAVRVPSRTDQDVRFNRAVFPTGGPLGVAAVFGNEDGFASTDLTAYEMGYRVQASPAVSVDATAFHNDYRHLGTSETAPPFPEVLPAPPHLVFPNTLANEADGHSYGVELVTNWRITDHWKVNVWYAFFAIQTEPYGLATASTIAGESPKHSAHLRSSWELPNNFSLQSSFYFVDRLKSQSVPRYTRGDIRLFWAPQHGPELSAGVQNAFQASHLEAQPGDALYPSNLVERAYDARLVWSF